MALNPVLGAQGAQVASEYAPESGFRGPRGLENQQNPQNPPKCFFFLKVCYFFCRVRNRLEGARGALGAQVAP